MEFMSFYLHISHINLFILLIVFCNVNAESRQCKNFDTHLGCLVELDNCLFLWSNGGIISVTSGQKSFILDFLSTPKYLNFDGDCVSNNETFILNLMFNQPYNRTSILLNITVWKPSLKSYWNLQAIELKIKNVNEEYEYQMDPKIITASNGFSFSCYSLYLTAKPNTTNDIVKLWINKFQLQPFATDGTVFAPSFDCSTWFSLASFMGLLTLLVFTITLSIGVYHLSNIKTMDRFENPKSRPLTILTSE